MLKRAAAIVAGVITVLAFAPFGFMASGIVGPAILFYLWLDAPPREAFLIGLLFGLGLFGLGVSWVYISMHVYGYMPVPMAAFAAFLFALILSMFPAMAGLVQAWVGGGATARLCLTVPALWTLFEWLRGWIFTGFPWLSLGYGQLGSPLSGLAQWLGVFGVTWATAVCAGLLGAAVLSGTHGRRVLLLGALASIWSLAWLAGQWIWVSPLGPVVKAAVVQGNVPLEEKWHPDRQESILSMYLQLSGRHRDRDLIVWPEAALPVYLDQLPKKFLRAMVEHPADIVTGISERQVENGKTRSYNSVLVVADGTSLYRKRHLVPFGEYLPLSYFLGWVLDYLQIPMSDFSAWQKPQQPIWAGGTRVGISICYEDAFLEEVRQALPLASLLVNVSEDAWFGDSFAPHQRLDMAKMRALENGRPMIRAGNTGVSAIIDHTGRVTEETPQFVRTVLRGDVQPMQGVTPFVRFGSWPVIIACMALVFSVVVKRRAAAKRYR